MVARYSRRTLLGAGLGGTAVLLAGGYTWDQYRTRHTIRLYHLEAVNESDETVTLEVTVTDAASDREGRRTASLEPAGGADETHLTGLWMKHAGEWRVDATLADHRLELSTEAIRNRLEGSGWGVDCANVAVVVTADGGLESRVEPSDVC